MKIFLWILLSTVIVSLLGFVGVLSLWMKKKSISRMAGYLVSFSAGALLGGAFFHLLAESVEEIAPMQTFGFALIGFVVFLLIEGFFHSHLCEKCTAHPFTYTMLFGDAIHNLIDGLVISAAYITNFPLGVITTFMIIGHETPQEIGLFGTLVHGGYGRKKAMWYSYIAQSTVIVGGLIGFLASKRVEFLALFLVPFAAGGFIYIAASDLVPEMHKLYEGRLGASFKVLLSFAAGILLMIALKVLFEG